MKLFRFIFLFLALFLGSGNLPFAWSSPCCARNAATPFLITGDDRAQINFGYSSSFIVGKADAYGETFYGAAQNSERLEMLRLDGALLLSDRWQAGVSLPIVRNSLANALASHSVTLPGDSRFNIGYEALTAWSYSDWKPQGFLFSTLTLPSGRSGFQSSAPLRADVTGNGFYSLSFGSLFLKRGSQWDAYLVPEGHYSFPRTFEMAQSNLKVTPGFGGSVGLGVGFSPAGGSLRFGMRIQPRYDQPVMTAQLPNFNQKQGAAIITLDMGMDVGYMLTRQDTLLITYTDQALTGLSMNSNLSRILAFNYQHRWER